MPWAILALSIAEMLLNAADRWRANNAQTGEMTPAEEAEFDKKRDTIRKSAAADPEQNK